MGEKRIPRFRTESESKAFILSVTFLLARPAFGGPPEREDIEPK